MLLSILIPTRNREELCLQAIESCLNSGFDDIDFEIVVSDNSDSPSPKLEAISKKYHHINYLRPSKVRPMSEHWEWAASHCSGRYLTVLTDRMLLIKGRLREALQLLLSSNYELLSFDNDQINDEGGCFVYTSEDRICLPIIISAELALKHVSQSEVYGYLPRMLNCIVSANFLEKLRHRYGAVFGGISPDFNFCFKALSELNEFIYYDRAINISHGLHLSNGNSFTKGKKNQDFIKLSGPEKFPTLYLWLTHSVIMNEYILILKSNAASPQIHHEKFELRLQEQLKQIHFRYRDIYRLLGVRYYGINILHNLKTQMLCEIKKWILNYPWLLRILIALTRNYRYREILGRLDDLTEVSERAETHSTIKRFYNRF